MILIVISFEKCRLDSSMNVENPGITSATFLCKQRLAYLARTIISSFFDEIQGQECFEKYAQNDIIYLNSFLFCIVTTLSMSGTETIRLLCKDVHIYVSYVKQ